MSKPVGGPKLQHYVPRALLKHFALPGKKRRSLHLFDKQLRQSVVTNVRNAAAESRFYNFEKSGHIYSAESSLERIETACEGIIAGLVSRNRSLDSSAGGDEDRAALAVFVAVQYLRTRTIRSQLAELPQSLATHLTANGQVFVEDFRELLLEPSPNEAAESSIRLMVEFTEPLANILLAKSWLLVESPPNSPFWIGDNPVVLQNDEPSGPLLSNLGFAIQGIQIYLPLSPKFALAIWCPSLVAHAKEVTSLMEQARALGAIDAKTCAEQIEHRNNVLTAIHDGVPLRLEAEHVKRMNYLQVRYAERFLMSQTSDFRLAVEILDRYPEFVSGVRASWSSILKRPPSPG